MKQRVIHVTENSPPAQRGTTVNRPVIDVVDSDILVETQDVQRKAKRAVNVG